mmetsp:Transcript_20488/g.37264  ORF Transcript_20488/g.37264 Transcript_20488/m.37264 type:complete len:444 (-) Transcript_20488:42-1373(-)
MWKDMEWHQYSGTMQLRLALAGSEWDGVTENDFEVRLSSNEVHVACKSSSSTNGTSTRLEAINGRLKKEIVPEDCWFVVEKDVRDPSGQLKVFILELAKQEGGTPWPDAFIVEQMFNRKYFPFGNQAREEQKDMLPKYVMLKPGRRKDVKDQFVCSRGWLCNEMEQGQTEEVLSFRIILDQKTMEKALEKVPYFKLFGVDVSERYLKVFIRGDEHHPVLLGKLGGKCLPDQTEIELTKVTRPVYGHRLGAEETLPCFDVTVVKAPDSVSEWQETLETSEEVMKAPVGTLEEYQALESSGRLDEEEDREDWTPDDWADEQKEKGDKAFKEAQFRDAVVYYTRALKYTPLNEKVLSNRSAAYLKISKFQLALDDAVKAQDIQPRWSKIYFRKGQALRGLKRFEDAITAFSEGKAVDPENAEWDNEVARTNNLKAAFEAKKSEKGK